ncbi:hypothetical protein C5D34_05595 [Rathayibacter sp. AY1B1]|nr:hypothetical protein C5D08_03350 [Rathayibacter sp. AY1B6]PPI36712.1 hypothetical protein C5D34_05595 [Rathayibacter sp. AY1B1]
MSGVLSTRLGAAEARCATGVRLLVRSGFSERGENPDVAVHARAHGDVCGVAGGRAEGAWRGSTGATGRVEVR